MLVAVSQERVQELLQIAEPLQGDERLVVLTFAAREWGKVGEVGRAHELLDRVAAENPTGIEARARLSLERAWLVLDEDSDTAPDRAADLAREAAGITASHLDTTPLGGLHIEALRLRARAADTADEQIASLRKAIALCQSSKDPEARAWEPRLLIDIARVDYQVQRIALARQRLDEAMESARRTGDEPAAHEAARLQACIQDQLDELARAHQMDEQETVARLRLPAGERGAPDLNS